MGWTSYNYPGGVSTATESATFDYGPNRQRWRMIYTGPSGNVTVFYSTRLFDVEYRGGPGVHHNYIYAGSRPVVEVSSTNGVVTVNSLLVDHQGSISSIVTDSTGAALVGESFTAYGNRREASTWSGAPTSGELTIMNGVTREGYTFQTVLGSMGLNHMNGRIEDSVTGRFLSADPRGTIPSNTQSWNRYSYVTNNPLTMTDPSGFSSFCDDSGCTVTADSGGDDGGGGGGGGAAPSSLPSFNLPPFTPPKVGSPPTAPQTINVPGVGTQPATNTISTDANGMVTIEVGIYSPDAASSPATNGVNTAPVWNSSAFTVFQGPMNTTANIFFLELAIFNPAVGDALTAVHLSSLSPQAQQRIVACTACGLSVMGQGLDFEALLGDIMGQEVPFSAVNLGPEIETPLQSGNEAFDEALSRVIWGNNSNPPPIPPQ